MCRRLTVKMVALDRSSKTFTFAGSYHIHSIASFENINRDPLPFMQPRGVVSTKLAQVAQGRNTLSQLFALRMCVISFQKSQMTTLRLSHATLDLALTGLIICYISRNFLEAKLHCSIAIHIFSLDLSNPAGTCFDHRY